MNCRNWRTWLLAAAVGLWLAAAPAFGADERAQPPKEVIERVGDLLGRITDELWIHNDEFWHQGEYRWCIAILGVITELDPHDTEAFGNRGWLLWNIGENDTAEAVLKKGISLNPNSYELFYDLGMHYYKLQRYDDAIHTLKTAQPLGLPDVGWKLLAHSYERSNRLDECIAVWEELEKMETGDPAVEFNLSRLRDKAADVGNRE